MKTLVRCSLCSVLLILGCTSSQVDEPVMAPGCGIHKKNYVRYEPPFTFTNSPAPKDGEIFTLVNNGWRYFVMRTFSDSICAKEHVDVVFTVETYPDVKDSTLKFVGVSEWGFGLYGLRDTFFNGIPETDFYSTEQDVGLKQVYEDDPAQLFSNVVVGMRTSGDEAKDKEYFKNSIKRTSITQSYWEWAPKE